MEKTIRSLGEFINYVGECKNKKYSEISEGGMSDKIVYRGQANKSWKCIPKIFRNRSWFENESEMVHEILDRYPQEFEGLGYFGKLVKMQHYGAPTRLLDFTINPLIALYFACDDATQEDEDGVVLLCVLPMFSEKERFLEIFLEKVYPNNDSLLMKVNRKNVEPVLQTSNVMGIMPKMNNIRIKNQEGCFALFTYSGEYATELFNPIDANNCIKERIIIPRECKSDILSELNSCGINRAFVYPELENQIKEICERY